MRIEHPLLKLPIRFCGDTLAREVEALPPTMWMEHPQKFDGNIAVPLVSPNGEMTDRWAGTMGPTEALQQCPYIMQVMGELNSTWGRSRLMGLSGGAVVPEHVDIHYYWRTHLRIHIPVITNPDVAFKCAGETVSMKPGECWILDSFFPHSVENRGQETRIHLVLDTVGSARLWDLIEAAADHTAEDVLIVPAPASGASLTYEHVNAPSVMSPWEMKSHVAYLIGWMDEEPRLESIQRILDRFIMAWGGTWARFETSDEGLPHYIRHLQEVHSELQTLRTKPMLMRNGWGLLDSLTRFVFANAIDPARLSPNSRSSEATARSSNTPALGTNVPDRERSFRDKLDRPIFLVSTPRSGSTLLFETLVQAPDLFSTGRESHARIEQVADFHPARRGWTSNRLYAADALPAAVEDLAEKFYGALRDRDGRNATGTVRMLEKTPKNALRVPFFNAAWNDSLFVYLYRDPRQTLASMIEAWLSGRFVTYPQLPGWEAQRWSLLLVPGWQELRGKTLPEIVAHQWATTTETLIDDLSKIDPKRLVALDYDQLLSDPKATMLRLTDALKIGWDVELNSTLPLSQYTYDPPSPDKWRKFENEIEQVWPLVESADAKARELLNSNRV